MIVDLPDTTTSKVSKKIWSDARRGRRRRPRAAC